MQFLRAYVAPFFIILVFLVAMLAVSARIFLPNDMMAPAPIEELETSAAPQFMTPVTMRPEPFTPEPISLTSLI